MVALFLTLSKVKMSLADFPRVVVPKKNYLNYLNFELQWPLLTFFAPYAYFMHALYVSLSIF